VTTLKEICLGIEQRYEIGYHEIGADEDHIHFLIQTVSEYAPSRIVQITKSIIAKHIFQRHPEVKQKLWGGEFCTKGYYINTVGQYGNEEVIRRYVQNQGKTYEQIHHHTPSLFT